jgi:hypothetical protein
MTMELGRAGKAVAVTRGSVRVGLAVAERLAAEDIDLLLVARAASAWSRRPPGSQRRTACGWSEWPPT